jgi:TadE-like protein
MRSLRPHPHKHDERGLATVEFVLLVPLLAALIFTIATVGAFFYRKSDVTGQAYYAARNVALTGAVGTLPADSAPTIDRACPIGPNPGDAIVTVSKPDYNITLVLVKVSRPLSAQGKYPCNPS